jgi:hypothetical protein
METMVRGVSVVTRNMGNLGKKKITTGTTEQVKFNKKTTASSIYDSTHA